MTSINDAFFSGPIAAERNPPINPQYYIPSRFEITAISEGIVTLVTTALPHNYVIGQEVRLLIPFYWGASQLNEQSAFVIAIPADDQVTLNIDSITYTPFGLADVHPLYPQEPQIVAIGDINSGDYNQTNASTSTVLPGSFIDISPN